MVRISLVLFCFCYCTMLRLHAQQFGGIPPSIHWKQINTDTARIIFPSGMEWTAEQVAAIVGRLNASTLPTIGSRHRKIDIVFQNQTTISNGYVQLAPFRSEFELTPSQNSFALGSLPWPKTLAIHEYRHVQQYNNFRVGLSKWGAILFGQGGQELANSLAVPNWFWEGDAVFQETLVSEQGRGRLPYFFNGYRSLWLARKNYSWMKLRNGSLRDYVPDHYPLGYMLVSYGRQEYGPEFWRTVTQDAAAFRGFFYPMQKAIQKYSKQSFSEFETAALQQFRNQYPSDGSYTTDYAYTIKKGHFIANQEFPQWLNDHQLVYMNSSYRKPPAFLMSDDGQREVKKIATRSISLDKYFTYANHQIVYAAFQPDARWGWKDYSELRLLDLSTGREKRITRHTRYFAPDLSADAQSVLAVQVTTDGNCALHILDVSGGQVKKIIPNPGDWFYTYPRFYGTGKVVSAVRNQRGEMALGVFDINSGQPDWLVDFSMNVIGFIAVYHDTIYFTATHEGKDQLFAIAGGQLFAMQISLDNLDIGNYNLQAGAGGYTWTSFSAIGYRLHVAGPGHVHLIQPVKGIAGIPLSNSGMLFNRQPGSRLLDSVVAGDRPVSHYPAGSHLLNFHSWRPFINDPDYSFSLVSENVLSTLATNISATYNRNEQSTQLGIGATYGGWYPMITGGADYTFNRNTNYRQQKVYWNEAEARLGAFVPWNLSGGKTFSYLQVGNDFIYNQRYNKGAYKDSFDNRGFTYINAYANFSMQSQQAPMQINPSLAQTIYLRYNRAITNLEANQFLASGYFYLPSLAELHSLVLSAAFQQRDTLNQARFSNSFPFSRGYTGENFYRMYRLGATYHFPLAYPDWGFGNMLYFLRVRADLFYDYTKALDYFTNGTAFHGQYRSFGAEMYFDTKWWNQLPISFGIRYSHLLDADPEGRGPNQWELVLPLTLLAQ